MKLPRDIGPVHFVGIGGIGTSGIAEVLANLGYTVQGSDAAESANVKRLREKGVKMRSGTRRKIWPTPRSSSSPRRSSATIRSLPRRAHNGCRWCAAPRCWRS
jgi:UDP-N-acetylmuramate-alanine ligase